MSTFVVPVVRLGAPRVHPNADRLEIFRIDGYDSIAAKDTLTEGTLAAYIPEAAIVPDDVLERMGLRGKLAGQGGNRVKAVRLRGALSQGILLALDDAFLATHGLKEGDDARTALKIVKYVPPVPLAMDGLAHAAHGRTIVFEIENLKRFPDAFADATPVHVTEKLHGSWCCLGLDPHGPVVSSKNLSARGLAFEVDARDNARNLYVRTWHAHEQRIHALAREVNDTVHVLGEAYGRKVQDLQYGQDSIRFAAFDVHAGPARAGRYLDPGEARNLCMRHGIEVVPLVHEGPFDARAVEDWTTGPSLVEGADHLREGVVVRSATETPHPGAGRLALKSISGDYLLRKGGTEHE